MSDVDDRAKQRYDSGRALLDAGDLVGAIVQLEASVDAFPHFKTLELLGEAWLRSNNPRRAVVPLAAATTLNLQVRAPSLLAEALLELGDEREAHRIARLALDRDPKNKKARRVFESTEAAYLKWNSLGSDKKL
jgi:hypothetical protein